MNYIFLSSAKEFVFDRPCRAQLAKECNLFWTWVQNNRRNSLCSMLWTSSVLQSTNSTRQAYFHHGTAAHFKSQLGLMHLSMQLAVNWWRFWTNAKIKLESAVLLWIWFHHRVKSASSHSQATDCRRFAQLVHFTVGPPKSVLWWTPCEGQGLCRELRCTFLLMGFANMDILG